jgi:uncharacterized protein YjbI with pentapeptide repeats
MPAADPKALLAAANSASEKVAALHIVFLAICAYVLVVVFGTTDVDLLIGKGVKLPVVDVEVPIVGFYAMAPYLLVLVHFNLLLSLQLLSRKLYAFDNAAQTNDEIGGLYEQLSVFPYNNYLVGRPTRLMRGFLALVVTITMLLLPLAALLTLQARFLAYQSEPVTWAQRLAVWLDVGLVAILWPVIMDRRESWSAYMAAVWRNARLNWLWWLWGAAGLLIAVLLLETEVRLPRDRWSGLPSVLVAEAKHYVQWLSEPWLSWLLKLLGGWLLLTLLAPLFRLCGRWLTHGRYFAPRHGAAFNPGARGLLAIVLLGLPLPLMLITEGEKIDRPTALATRVLGSLRRLDLREKVLLAKPPSPEILADLRGTDPARLEAALRSVQRVDLQNRSLRKADLSSALMPKADLRQAQLQGAVVVNAQLQRADFTGAQLQGAMFGGDGRLIFDSMHFHGANFKDANLQRAVFAGARLNGTNLSKADLQHAKFAEVLLEGVNLEEATMQGTEFEEVSLQGANLSKAKLQGAQVFGDLRGADLTKAHLQGAALQGSLQGANLSWAYLQGANLSGSRLQGADLSQAQLHGADLSRAQLQGADLSTAQLEGVTLRNAVLYSYAVHGNVDARGLKWRPLSAKEIQSLSESQANLRWWNDENRSRYQGAIEKAGEPGLRQPIFTSCVRDDQTEVACSDLPLEQFRLRRLAEIEKAACQALENARGFLHGYAVVLQSVEGGVLYLENRVKTADEKSCPGLAKLSPRYKAYLSKLASKDHARASGPGKGSPATAVVPKR